MSVYYSTNTVNVRTYQHFGEEARIYNIHIIQKTQNLLVTHLTVAHHHHHERITPIEQEICEQEICDQYIQLVLRLQIVHIYLHSPCAFMAFTETTFLHFTQVTEFCTYYAEYKEQQINVQF